jgi:hypothetical protein
MRRLLIAAALLCAAGSSFANTMVARQGSDWVRITDAPCTNENVLSRIAPGAHKQFRAATSGISGAPFAACWVPNGGAALLVYEDGDRGIIPLNEFKEDLGI